MVRDIRRVAGPRLSAYDITTDERGETLRWVHEHYLPTLHGEERRGLEPPWLRASRVAQEARRC